MSKFIIIFKKIAQKKLFSLNNNDQKKVTKVLIKLEQNPLSSQLNIKKLKGTNNSWRIRVGDLRILYTFNTDKKIILIFKIDFRGSIYK